MLPAALDTMPRSLVRLAAAGLAALALAACQPIVPGAGGAAAAATTTRQGEDQSP